MRNECQKRFDDYVADRTGLNKGTKKSFNAAADIVCRLVLIKHEINNRSR